MKQPKLINRFVVHWTDQFNVTHYLKDSEGGRMRWSLSFDDGHRFSSREVAETWCQRMGGDGMTQLWEANEDFHGGREQKVESPLFKLN